MDGIFNGSLLVPLLRKLESDASSLSDALDAIRKLVSSLILNNNIEHNINQNIT